MSGNGQVLLAAGTWRARVDEVRDLEVRREGRPGRRLCLGSIEGSDCREFVVNLWEERDEGEVAPGSRFLLRVNEKYPMFAGRSAGSVQRPKGPVGGGGAPRGGRPPQRGGGSWRSDGERMALDRRIAALRLAIEAKGRLEEFKENSVSKIADRFDEWLRGAGEK